MSASMSPLAGALTLPSPLRGEGSRWWAHLDSNQDRTGYEPGALPIELWARRSSYHRCSRLQEAPELLGARGMPELAERLGLDLPDALAGDREVLADLFQRVLAAVRQAEPRTQNLFVRRREGIEDLVGLLPHGEPDNALDRRADLLVLDEVAQVAVLFLADRRLERDGLLGDLEDLADFVDRHFHLDRDLFRGGLPAELLDQL